MRKKSNKIYYKTAEEIELIRQSCLLVSKTLALVGERLRPGAIGKEIDAEAEAFIRDHGAVPGFKGYNDFPATLCVSRNEAVVHGIPTDEPFKDGDIVSVDCGVYWNNFFGDAAYTFAIGDVDEKTMELLRTTKASLYKGIDQAKVGRRVGDISFAIQHYVRKHRYGIVRELVGHGVGKELHEAPEVPNYGKRGKGFKLQEGLVIAIEPMINLGRQEVRALSDDWTVVTIDNKPSAHYEHTVAVGKKGADILSDHSFVEAAIAKNPNLKEVLTAEEALA
ncbi:MAG: type I methionyl aminopeptidase [Bacteroidota bacterium]